MCFSASASFTASIFLIPTGIYCLSQANKKDRTYLPIASLPLFFGIQQGFEGFLWLNIFSDNQWTITNLADCFLFFSHFFWLFWIPFTTFYLEKNQTISNILKTLATIGFIYGILLYFPLLINNDWVQIAVTERSINYNTNSLFNYILPHNFSFYLYTLIIIVPLMVSSNKAVNILGILLALGILITYFSFYYAFISVWCFIAAISSIYLVYVIKNIPAIDSSQA